MNGLGFAVTDQAIAYGIEQVDWPGRLERVRRGDVEVCWTRPITRRALDRSRSTARRQWTAPTLIFAAMADKDIGGILAPLLPRVGPIVCTTAPTPRAARADDLARLVGEMAPGRDVEHRESGARARACMCHFISCCRGWLDVFDRPPAWYSSLIPAAAHPRMFRLSLSFLLCVLCHWALVPAPALAQVTMTGCKSDALQSQVTVQHDANHWTLTGTAARPIQIDCDDMQLFANTVELSTRRRAASLPPGDVAFVSGESRISAERLDYDTRAKTGSSTTSRAPLVLRDKGAARAVRRAGTERVFLGRRTASPGPEEVSASSAAASPRACSRRRAGMSVGLDHAEPRRLRAPEERGLPRQGRAGAVPADLLLPAGRRRPVDRLPDADLRLVDAAGQSMSAPFFWAIGRSQDATFTYDWFSKAGQAVTGEYRYMLAPGRGHAPSSTR